MSGSTWRWLMIGSFTAAPTGRKYPVSGESFAAVMRRLDVRADVPIPALLGELVDEKTFPLKFDRPRVFRVADIIAAIDPLKRLEALAVALTRDHDVPPAVAAARAEKIVGAGHLAAAIRGDETTPPDDDDAATPRGDEPTAPAAVAGPSANDSALDAIFAKVDTSTVAPAKAAKSSLDAFIGAMRSDRPRAVKLDPNAGRDAAHTIRTRLSEVALRILGQPAVARIESCWRGLKMVMAETPGHEDLSVQIVDADAEADELQLAMERHVSKIDPARPDAVFIAHALAPKMLEWLAAFGAERGVPIVVGVNEALTGRVWHDPDDVAESLEWAGLRSNAAASYLCAVANPVVLCNESVIEGPPRLVLGSAAWGIAAMLASAIKRHEDPGAMLGRPGALVAPAAHEVELGLAEPRTIPTAAFAALPQQRRAAEHGIVLLGSEAGSDQIIATSATMVGGGASLPDRLRQAARAR